MRPIKFKVWSRVSNRWAEAGILLSTNGGIFELSSDSGDMFLQFTSLIDKNGKEIYEGDIVKRELDFGDRPTEVTFNHGAFFAGGHFLGIFMPEVYEVIGNIYEHPELLLDPVETSPGNQLDQTLNNPKN